jgi:hypothetical protein
MLWISPKELMKESDAGVLEIEDSTGVMEMVLELLDAGVTGPPMPAKKARPPRALEAYMIVLHLS